MPPNAAKVDRTTVFGNPWSIRAAREAGYRGTDRQLSAWCVDLFREWVENRPGSVTSMLKDGDFMRARLLGRLESIRGKDLACWCKPGDHCHADVLLELANPNPEG
jgi:hypothetical protein